LIVYIGNFSEKVELRVEKTFKERLEGFQRKDLKDFPPNEDLSERSRRKNSCGPVEK
jgi:hypothetical protein